MITLFGAPNLFGPSFHYHTTETDLSLRLFLLFFCIILSINLAVTGRKLKSKMTRDNNNWLPESFLFNQTGLKRIAHINLHDQMASAALKAHYLSKRAIGLILLIVRKSTRRSGVTTCQTIVHAHAAML